MKTIVFQIIKKLVGTVTIFSSMTALGTETMDGIQLSVGKSIVLPERATAGFRIENDATAKIVRSPLSGKMRLFGVAPGKLWLYKKDLMTGKETRIKVEVVSGKTKKRLSRRHFSRSSPRIVPGWH